MARGINKDYDEFELYLLGKSIPEISEITNIPKSTLRFRFKKAGILRDRADAVRLAFENGRVPSTKGSTRVFTQEWKDNISKGKLLSGQLSANGVDIHRGYPRITRGKNAGKCVHTLVIESWLERDLKENECVHHIDGNPLNNSLDNLALMTRAGHARLHRYQDQLAGKEINRDKLGRLA